MCVCVCGCNVCNLCRCKYAHYKTLLILLYIRIPPSVTVRYCGTIINYTHMPYKPHAGLAQSLWTISLILIVIVLQNLSGGYGVQNLFMYACLFAYVCMRMCIHSVCAYCVSKFIKAQKTEFQATHFLDKRKHLFTCISISQRTIPR